MLLAGAGLIAAAPEGETAKVTAVRFWSLGDVTRIAVEVNADFRFRSEKLSEPPRLVFDIRGAKPSVNPKGVQTIAVGDGIIKQIRIAENQPGVTRVVLDLVEPAEFTSSQLALPSRLMIEVRGKNTPDPATLSSTGGKVLAPAPVAADVPVDVATARNPGPRKFEPPVLAEPAVVSGPKVRASAEMPLPNPSAAGLMLSGKPVRPLRSTLPSLPPPAAEPVKPEFKEAKLAPPMVGGTVIQGPISAPVPAKRTASGGQSLTRALGLKLGRVVLDAGHGGHDVGTHGPSGLYEKDLVLDIALRLGKLLEARLDSEVIYTRSDDTFIPLEERTQLANQARADLFLSIHANSSPVRSVSGVETYYLNFSTSKTALDTAARENASSGHSIFELKDLLNKIALRDKIDESREFASHLQNSLYTISAKNNKSSKDRGIKKAPFVVLIGADMPSVLAEIGFLTNAQDEAQLRKEEHRDKIAEALYKGIASYADSLAREPVVAKSSGSKSDISKASVPKANVTKVAAKPATKVAATRP